MTWQEELSRLITCGWEPIFKGGRFAVLSRYKSITVTLTPPQGVYALWFIDVTSAYPKRTRVSFSGSSAFELIGRVNHLCVRDANPCNF